VHGLQGQDFKNKEIEGALDKVSRFAHVLIMVSDIGYHKQEIFTGAIARCLFSAAAA
jgi:hypothetical protein